MSREPVPPTAEIQWWPEPPPPVRVTVTARPSRWVGPGVGFLAGLLLAAAVAGGIAVGKASTPDPCQARSVQCAP